MIETLKSLILDYQEARLETGVPRRLHVESVHGKATVYIGVRRSGKSTFMFQSIQRLLDAGVPRQNLLYLNFFDDRLHILRQDDLGLVAEAYYSLYPDKKGTETVYCFFDEIQAVPGWEPFIDRMMRTEKCEVVLTGSSARMLSKEVATQMRGRALSWEMFPFSFQEFLDCRGIESDAPFSTKRRLQIQKAFEEYWTIGGFPEVVAQLPRWDGTFQFGDPDLRYGVPIAMPENLRVKTHQEYLQAILFRDLVERHDISHPKAVSDLAHWLIDNTASTYSVRRLTRYLKNLGHHAPYPAVSDYVQWFEDAYFLFSVPIFDASLARRNANPKKIYCVDHAWVVSVSSGILVNSGHLLENLVFTTLRRHHPEVFYYKTSGDREVDFAVPLRGRSRLLIQVSESLADPRSRARETTALVEAMEEQGAKAALLVTRHEQRRIETKSGVIHVVPAWRFLLDAPEWLK